MGSLGYSPDTRPERVLLGGSIEICRVINGLWQLAGGHDQEVNLQGAAEVMDDMISCGFDTFDMADHYGDAELVVGRHNQMPSSKSIAFTKWCPQENGVKSFANAEGAVSHALNRMGQKKIELLQCKRAGDAPAWNQC